MSSDGIFKRVLDAIKRWIGPGVVPQVAFPSSSSTRVESIPREARSSEVAALTAEAQRTNAARARRAARTREAEAAVVTFVASVRHLPFFSSTATQLIRSVGRDDVSANELARLISTDAALVAHLLRIVNSPYYGLSRRLATVADVLAVLGFDQVRRTITAAVLQRPVATIPCDTAAVRDFWRHGLLCAALARHLAIRSRLDGEVAYMAGLMHDVGRLAMLVRRPDAADLLLRTRAESDEAGIARELPAFGFDHAQAGGSLLALWGLPVPIAQAAYDHADETKPADPMSASVWRANRLTHALIETPADADVQQPWMIEIGLSIAERQRILDEIRALEA